jgi:hypothetical protein
MKKAAVDRRVCFFRPGINGVIFSRERSASALMRKGKPGGRKMLMIVGCRLEAVNWRQGEEKKR